ncbi:MAG: transposase [Candidatus Latescibacteria bacterium]|nr:transposase [Candidatus Latescibacterota bacterium]
MSKRRSYSPQFKAEVVLEALKGEKSAAQICRERSISHDLSTRWRRQFLERALRGIHRGSFRLARAGAYR